jgi:hypothetical protein
MHHTSTAAACEADSHKNPTPSRCKCSMLARVAPRLVSFEEQVAAVREALAALHEQQEDWTAAAQTLAGIDLDSGNLS